MSFQLRSWVLSVRRADRGASDGTTSLSRKGRCVPLPKWRPLSSKAATACAGEHFENSRSCSFVDILASPGITRPPLVPPTPPVFSCCTGWSLLLFVSFEVLRTTPPPQPSSLAPHTALQSFLVFETTLLRGRAKGCGGQNMESTHHFSIDSPCIVQNIPAMDKSCLTTRSLDSGGMRWPFDVRFF